MGYHNPIITGVFLNLSEIFLLNDQYCATNQIIYSVI